ncbi:NACHT domain-containing protein [Actinosynnema sp. NPDC050436]|uniref:NACHT domain-containing protein n=1 Tax=Actinosynnema sp. NPDC050436 TaxID=3155659 RepID=UPI003410C69C
MRRSGLPGWVWLVASVGALVGGVVWFLGSRSLPEADNLASVGGLVLGVAVGVPGLVVSVAALRVARGQARQPAPDRLLDELAAALDAELRRERGVRDLNDLLPVRWSVAPADLADRAERVFAGASPDVAAGSVDDVVATFGRLPRRRLVVLGDPGAGKSVVALELALGLLAARAPGGPVPVVLPVAGWDPAADEPAAWIARRIADAYPALGATRGGTTLAETLVRTHRVVPVLDGLDEMAAPSRAAAVRAVNRWVPRDEPVVLTCRTAAYRDLLAAPGDPPGEPLAGAAVVVLEPLGVEEAVTYLRDATPPRLAARWDPVAAHLAGAPDGPLASALSTPLMAALARTTYSRADADPAELLGAHLDGRAAVEDHLLARFVPALYPGDRRALRWLRFLAWQLDRRGTQDIAWWELPRLVPRTAFVAVVGLLFLLVGLLDGLVVADPVRPLTALAAGLAVGVGAVLADRHASLPVRTVLRPPTTLDQFTTAFRAALTGLSASVAVGLGFGVAYGYVTQVVFDDTDHLRIGLETGLAVTTALSVPLTLVMLMTAPVDIARATTPRATLRADRTRALVVAATALLTTFPLLWLQSTSWISVFIGPAVAVVLWVTSAWGALGVLRVLSPLRPPSRLPVRLVEFLAEAHRRGVLRQAGATYQFRHLRLQEHLARTHPYRRDHVGVPQERGDGMRVVYGAALLTGLVAVGYLYFVAFDRFSETLLLRVIPLWLFPLVFGSYGLVGEWLARRAGGEPLTRTAAQAVRRYGKWVWPVVLPFRVLPWRSRVLVVTAGTAFWAALVQWFVVAVFPSL